MYPSWVGRGLRGEWHYVLSVPSFVFLSQSFFWRVKVYKYLQSYKWDRRKHSWGIGWWKHFVVLTITFISLSNWWGRIEIIINIWPQNKFLIGYFMHKQEINVYVKQHITVSGNFLHKATVNVLVKQRKFSP